ncbi:MAG: hypothetical protein IKC32_01260 [Clostridia bacterium]|nr:hypothetical protein [Clostridia bacterium]
MKKTFGILMLLTMLLCSLTALTACGGDGSPEGMQLIRGGEDIGYYFYGPEEWIVANQEKYGIACSYVSKLDNSSVTLVEADMPETSITEYVAEEMKKFPEGFELTSTLAPKEDSFGNAERAYKTSYTYKYAGFSYRTMQIYAIYGERFYIFTYNAPLVNYSEEETYYDRYLEKVEAVIKNVKFVDISGGEDVPAPEYEKDADGFSLVSDRAICGFDFYMPESYKLDWATSMVSVTRTDGSNITVSEATDTNVDDNGYWRTRFEQLGRIATEVKAVEGSKVGVDLGDGLDAVSMEYTYTMMGKDYKVYQVLIVNGFKGYVYTFTAEAELYDGLKDEATTILYKIEF